LAPALSRGKAGSSAEAFLAQAREAGLTSDSGLSESRQVKVVLLENIHERAMEIFEDNNFRIESYSSALSGQELIEVAADAHILGIRSKTKLTQEFFDAIGEQDHRLWAVGCFCIGTNQVDLIAAASKGVTVFNAPFSNTRSVAEKTLAEVIVLQRRLFHASYNLHKGQWTKSASGCHEVRGKTLGIIGYGRIGSQVSVLAEGLGLKTLYFDSQKTLTLGNAVKANSMEELLGNSDIVTLHVPQTPLTKNMITATELAMMKPGAQLINNARGDVVDMEALALAIKSGHLSGAVVDVFPQEPEANTGPGEYNTPLQGLDNVILTPHIGGSTLEAQRNIAEEVAEKLVNVLRQGTTTTSGAQFPPYISVFPVSLELFVCFLPSRRVAAAACCVLTNTGVLAVGGGSQHARSGAGRGGTRNTSSSPLPRQRTRCARSNQHVYWRRVVQRPRAVSQDKRAPRLCHPRRGEKGPSDAPSLIIPASSYQPASPSARLPADTLGVHHSILYRTPLL
jgi:D-3-phosphoglycerate dehydrogenase